MDTGVYVDGLQYADGRVDREIRVCQLHTDNPLTPSDARRLADALIAAADAVETVSNYDPASLR